MLWSEEIHEEEEKEKMEMDVEQLNRKFDDDVLDFDFDGNYPFIPPSKKLHELSFPSYEGSLDFEDQPQFEEDTSLDDILEVLLTKQQHSMDSQSHELNENEIYDGLSSFSSSPETLNTNPNVFSYGSFSRSIDELFYQRLQSAKRDGRYSLKIKCSGAVMDDGYRWRKYGQKSIKNSPYPRSYYRCTNPRCCAKKQVERSVEDPESMTITYEGLHLHYSYSYLQNSFPNTNQDVNMNTSLEVNSPSNNTKDVVSSPQETHEGSLEPLHQSHLQHHRQRTTDSSSECKITDPVNAFSGLLEDIVPREILNPTAHESLSYPCSLDAHGFL